MTRTKTNKRQLFSNKISKGIDRSEGNIIFGASVIELGEVNDDRPWIVDQRTLEQVVEFGSRPQRGLKAKFTHPNMSNDGLGTHLGYWKNFRIDGSRVRADLHISDSAFKSPKGDLGGYVLALAEEDPEAFGVSVSTRIDFAAMGIDEAGNPVEEAEGDLPLRFAALRSADFVDEPAATRGGLFSESMALDDRFENVDIASMLTWVLDNHFENENPEEIRDRVSTALSTYFKNQGIVEDLPNPDTEGTMSEETTKPDGNQYLELFGDQGARWFIEGKSIEDCHVLHSKQLSDELEKTKKENADLQDRIKNTQLGEDDGPDGAPNSTDDGDAGEQVTTRKNFSKHIRLVGVPASSN